MAFTTPHIVACYAGGDGFNDSVQSIPADAVWSEAPASGVATTAIAPPANGAAGRPMFRISAAAADIYVAIGKTAPNPSASPRYLVRAGQDFDVFANEGDKAAWVAA